MQDQVCYLQSKDAPRDASLALATSSALADLCRRSSLNLASIRGGGRSVKIERKIKNVYFENQIL